MHPPSFAFVFVDWQHANVVTVFVFECAPVVIVPGVKVSLAQSYLGLSLVSVSLSHCSLVNYRFGQVFAVKWTVCHYSTVACSGVSLLLVSF